MWAVAIVLCTHTHAQTTHYLHYTTLDGLPSNKVYCANQDAAGFIWLGTDNGLVRYNGSEFKTYTVRDGLPDNDIYTVFEDAQNKLWVLGFKQAPCYFYNNQLYTTRNDTFLARYFKDPDMFRFCVNRNLKRIVFYVIYNEKVTVLEYGKPLFTVPTPDPPRKFIKGTTLNLHNNGKNDYLMNSNNFFKIGFANIHKTLKRPLLSVDEITYRNNKVGFYYSTSDKKVVAFVLKDDSIHVIKSFDMPNCIGPYTSYNNEAMFINESGDMYLLDTASFEFIKERATPFEGRHSTAFIDNKGNKWLCTHDNGLYAFPKYSSEILTEKKGATCIVWNADRKEIITGFENKSLLMYSKNNTAYTYYVADRKVMQSRITSLVYNKGVVYIGGDFILGKYATATKKYTVCKDPHRTIVTVIKDMELCNDGRILIGSANGAGYYNSTTDNVSEYLWNTRTTAVCEVPHKGVYLGTVNGLHHRPQGKDTILPYTTGTELDKARITDIKYDKEERIWVGTAQYGLYVIDGINIYHLDDNRNSKCYITSYYVKCIFIDENDVAWVGTDKGINRVTYGFKDDCRVDRITTSFGIPNDNITALWVQHDSIYLASLDGVSRFSYNTAVLKEVPGLEITGLVMNGKLQPIINQNVFDYFENNIGIEYSAIAFRSAKNIEFDYRLANTNQQWIRTKSNRIDLLGLKPGGYQFEIRAINTITGELSPTRFFEFTILKPWYQSYWFTISLICIGIIIIWWLVVKRINTIKKQSHENTRINKQFAELEMQALRAQMNPHFIFNALSAIQNYFVTNKEEKANAYMAKFARLIRQMLDYSKDNFIPLDEEISLINNYMVLEKMRFGDKLDFSINIDNNIDPSEYVLPSLLLQPILENAVNHGIMPSSAKGIIELSIRKKTLFLECEIRDNGIGINQSKINKMHVHGHQSKGMDILSKRIESINHLYNCNVRLDIADLSEKNHEITGTAIMIRFPLSLVNKTIQN